MFLYVGEAEAEEVVTSSIEEAQHASCQLEASLPSEVKWCFRETAPGPQLVGRLAGRSLAFAYSMEVVAKHLHETRVHGVSWELAELRHTQILLSAVRIVGVKSSRRLGPDDALDDPLLVNRSLATIVYDTSTDDKNDTLTVSKNNMRDET